MQAKMFETEQAEKQPQVTGEGSTGKDSTGEGSMGEGSTGRNSTFEEILAREGRLVYTNHGVSMMPLLRQGKDLFVVTPARERLKRYDVALFRRKDQYVLHRVLKVLPEGYIICGDHCWQKEKVAETQILGVMTSFVRDGRETPVTDRRYLAYVHLWCDLFVVRAFLLRVRSFIRIIMRR